MKKRSTRVSPNVKNTVKLRHRLRYVTVAGAFALGVFAVTLVYNTLGTSKESIANNRINGMETLAEFKFRKQLTIDTALMRATTLTDFPLMISITDEDLRSASHGGKVVSEKGYDIRFTKSDGVSLLDYEIETYNPATGRLVAWVRIDSLNKNIAQPLFLYFSNKFSADESTQNTWNKTYKGVWHLKGALSSKMPFANQLAQQPAPATSPKDVYVAAERNSSRFPCLNTPEDVDITGDITVSAWVYLTDSKEQTILSNQNGYNGGYRLSVNKHQRVEFSVCNENAEAAAIKGKEGIELAKNTWYHIAAVYSDAGDSMVTYINGQRDQSLKTYLNMAGSTEALQIGREPSRKIYYFGGLLDEVHVSNIARTQQWIASEYRNQHTPQEFVKAGVTESIIQQISMSLLTLDAEVQGQTVELKWLTANEVDNQQFTIERSVDGITYEIIGTKPGAGNSIEVLSYRFRDEKPKTGNNYYRIKLTDSKGNDEYSMITPAQVEAPGEGSIRVASAQPNPFVKDFQVEYVVPNNGSAKVKLTSIQGELVMEEDVACEKEKPQHFFFKDEKGIRPGVYFLTIAQEEETKTVKLIKRM